MQIGNPSYKKCPHCRESNEYYFGPFFVNLYGYTEWSDGEIFQQLPSFEKTELQKCNSCNQYYWFTQYLGGLSFENYVEAAKYFQEEYSKKSIANLLFKNRNKRRLLYIRLHILRRYNDTIRIHPLNERIDNKKIKSEYERLIFAENAKHLIHLLKIFKPNNHLLIAEIYRNLGEFKKAKNEITKLNDVTIKELILTHIENENRDVITIKQPLTKPKTHLK